MTNFRMLVTNDGKHPASKWADLAVDDLMEISAQAPAALYKEAMQFRKHLHDALTKHLQHAMDHEQQAIAVGRHDPELPYVTEDHAQSVVQEVVNLAHGTSFGTHFAQEHVQTHIENVCNHYFKSAKHVERQHFHSERARATDADESAKKTKRS